MFTLSHLSNSRSGERNPRSNPRSRSRSRDKKQRSRSRSRSKSRSRSNELPKQMSALTVTAAPKQKTKKPRPTLTLQRPMDLEPLFDHGGDEKKVSQKKTHKVDTSHLVSLGHLGIAGGKCYIDNSEHPTRFYKHVESDRLGNIHNIVLAHIIAAADGLSPQLYALHIAYSDGTTSTLKLDNIQSAYNKLRADAESIDDVLYEMEYIDTKHTWVLATQCKIGNASCMRLIEGAINRLKVLRADFDIDCDDCYISHGDMHQDNVRFNPTTQEFMFIDWDRASFTPSHVEDANEIEFLHFMSGRV